MDSGHESEMFHYRQAIAQINKLEKENEQYKKQNKELKEENKELKELNKVGLEELASEAACTIRKLMTENKELKEDHQIQFDESLDQDEQILQLKYEIEQLELDS